MLQYTLAFRLAEFGFSGIGEISLDALQDSKISSTPEIAKFRLKKQKLWKIKLKALLSITEIWCSIKKSSKKRFYMIKEITNLFAIWFFELLNKDN